MFNYFIIAWLLLVTLKAFGFGYIVALDRQYIAIGLTGLAWREGILPSKSHGIDLYWNEYGVQHKFYVKRTQGDKTTARKLILSLYFFTVIVG